MRINNSPLSEKKETQNFYAIDLAKFICAILVVSIHVPLGNYGIVKYFDHGVHYFARLAVPFFFMSTGFLLFRKIDQEEPNLKYIWKYCLKLFRLYCVWTIIYGYWIFKEKYTIYSNSKYIAILFIRDFIFAGSYLHLWYLPATIFAVLIIAMLLYKKFRLKTILLLSSFFYCIGLFAQSYFGLLTHLRKFNLLWDILKICENVIVTTRDGLFEGFFFVSLGMLFAYLPIRMSTKKAIVGLLISMLLFLIESALVRHLGWGKEKDLYLMLAPSAFFAFYIISHVDVKGRDIYKVLRLMSSLIFYLHVLINNILSFCFSKFPYELKCMQFMKFNIVLIISCLLSYVIIKLSNIKKLGWLKLLYS